MADSKIDSSPLLLAQSRHSCPRAGNWELNQLSNLQVFQTFLASSWDPFRVSSLPTPLMSTTLDFVVIASKALTWASAEALPTVACSRMAASSSSTCDLRPGPFGPFPSAFAVGSVQTSLQLSAALDLLHWTVGFLQQETGTSLVL